MVVQHNLRAMNSNRMLGITTSQQAKSSEKLSSGYRINRAADDAAGLSISEKMRRQIRGLTQASTNAQDGISLAQTAEGALAEVQDMLQRMNELTVQAANGTSTSTQKGYIADEIKQLASEIDRIATTTKFNDKLLFSSETTSCILQVGAEKGETMNVITHKMKVSALFTGKNATNLVSWNTANITNSTVASFITSVKTALEKVSSERSSLGAMQNRLEHTIKNLDNIVENTTSAESSIRDTDIAEEMVRFSNNNILAQAGQAMLAQSNQANQGVLSLLQ